MHSCFQQLCSRSPVSFFNGPATPEVYTLSLHDALPISCSSPASLRSARCLRRKCFEMPAASSRSEEHTSELQSHSDLVCRLLLEKKTSIPSTTLSTNTRNRC